MTVLLVASSGGHLTQLDLIAPRLVDVTDAVWVSYDHPHAASLLEGRRYVAAHGPSTRSIPNAVRNWRAAARLLDEHDVTRVVSTGAGIAVPFLKQARRRGIPATYVESATRVEHPSLTGRILERGRDDGLELLTQHERWADRSGWSYRGSVFDGFVVRERHHSGPLRMLVTLGTHDTYSYERLLLRLAAVVESGDEVVWQVGNTVAPVKLPGRVEVSLPSDEIERLMASCDVVVAHAGTGTALSSMLAGRPPVLVPRRAEFGEHVDDHQVPTALELARRGVAIHAEADRLDRALLLRAASLQVGTADRNTATQPAGPASTAVRAKGSAPDAGASRAPYAATAAEG